MRITKTLLAIATVTLLMVAAACRKNDDVKVMLTSKTIMEFDARCQRDTICFETEGNWHATTDSQWLTLEQLSGKDNGMLSVYIEQNDTDHPRTAMVTVTNDNGNEVTIFLKQKVHSANGNINVDLPVHYGLGWGYDVSIDYADIDGISGQVFDAAALTQKYGKYAIRNDASAYTDLQIASGNTHQEMQEEISGKLSGELDLAVASAKVSGEYSKQIHETIDRRYIWYRDFRTVRVAYFGNDAPPTSSRVITNCVTEAFRESVANETPQKIVKRFGTHVVTSASLGGKVDYYFTVSQKVTETTEKIVTTVQVKVLFVKKSSTKVEENTWTDIQRDFVGRFEVRGGGKVGEELNRKLQSMTTSASEYTEKDAELFKQWDERFVDPNTVNPKDLVMVDFQVVPIWEIIEALNPDKAEAVRDYIVNTYLKPRD